MKNTVLHLLHKKEENRNLYRTALYLETQQVKAIIEIMIDMKGNGGQHRNNLYSIEEQNRKKDITKENTLK